MKTIVLNDCEITVHDSAHTLPESRRVEHDYYSLVESGIGSTIEDFDTRIEQIKALLLEGEPDGRFEAFKNLRYLFYNILHRQYSPRSLAFACLVETVDGVSWTNYSESGVEQLVVLLSEKGLTNEIVQQYWPELRKKSEGN